MKASSQQAHETLCNQATIHSLAVNCMYSAAQRTTRQQNKITHVGLTSMIFDQHDI
jgi:hypothetical protein